MDGSVSGPFPVSGSVISGAENSGSATEVSISLHVHHYHHYHQHLHNNFHTIVTSLGLSQPSSHSQHQYHTVCIIHVAYCDYAVEHVKRFLNRILLFFSLNRKAD
jgi:hypothetical protein